jgi:hypothetical protein
MKQLEFDPFQHTKQTEAVQPVLELDGFNVLGAVDINLGDRVARLGDSKSGRVLSFRPVSGRMKARVRFDDGTVRHYEKHELRKI